MHVCNCANPYCKVNGCQILTGQRMKSIDWFKDLPSREDVITTTREEIELNLEPLTTFEETVLQLVDLLIEKGVSEEEILKRLLA